MRMGTQRIQPILLNKHIHTHTRPVYDFLCSLELLLHIYLLYV